MDELTVTRTPLIIATEINSIKEQTKRIILSSSIEIGRRLTEAKSLIEYGEWGTWLKESVAYSQSTANNLMRIFEQYGADQLSLFGSDAKSQALGNLSYMQAVALLGIPQNEREQFIDEHDMDNLSTRELQQAIKDREQAVKENEDLKQKLENAKLNAKEAIEANDKIREDKDKAEIDARLSERVLRATQADLKALQDSREKERKESLDKVTNLELTMLELKNQLSLAQSSGNVDEIERLQESLNKTDNELESSCGRIKELERQLKEKPIEVNATQVVEKVPEEIEQELYRLREKTKELESKSSGQSNAAVVKFSIHFESLVKGFGDLLGSLAEIKDIDLEAHEKYKNAVNGLIGKMTDRL